MVGRWSCRNPLSLQERIKIREAIDLDMSYREMAEYVGREKSVLVKECNKRGGYENYDAHKAQEHFERIQRERRRKKESMIKMKPLPDFPLNIRSTI